MNPVADAIVKTEVKTDPAILEGDKPLVDGEKVDESMSSKLSLLARKERAIVQKQQENQRKFQEWEKEKKELLEKLSSRETSDKLWDSDPLKALEARGLDYQKLTEKMLTGDDLTPKDLEKKMEERLKSYEQKLEEEKKAREKEKEDYKTAQEKAIIDNFKADLKTHLSSKADTFKLASLYDEDAELAFDVIDAYYRENNEVLEVEDALAKADKYFMDLFEKGAAKLGYKKVDETVDPKTGSKLPEIKKPTQTTLTNAMNTTMSVSTLPAKTEEDRVKRALAALDKNK